MVMMMVMMMIVMGCNSGGVGGGEGAAGVEGRGLNEVISSSRQVFLETFLSFSDLLKGIFGITADTTKKAVGERLDKVGEAVNVAKSKLEGLKITDNYNVIKAKADGIITKAIDTLKKIVDGVSKIKGATDTANDKIASAIGDAEDASPADKESVKGLIEGISMICEASRGVGIDFKGDANKIIADSKEIGKLFGATANANEAKALSGANRAVIAVSGADILAAIEAAKDSTSKNAGDINAATNAYDIAIATKNHADAHNDVKTNASVLAAGLALRGMAKDGKLATVANHAPKEGINAVLSRAVSKIVNEIMFNIRRTVDKCLKDVNDCIEENFSSEVKSK
ncbi:variable large family protein [Borrelia crocidurae]|uniref:Variable large protein n=1 Tax=Borrelia crocidurae (strain Achema) TaxID=1155096 RepID=I0FFB3_BORCA|nr:variable large family protein [Borrelia crocidurae]AFI32169.1 Vlp protein [Borrelia crocidurae str. Achema]